MIEVSYFVNLIGENVLVIKQNENTDYIRMSRILKLDLSSEKLIIKVLKFDNTEQTYEYTDVSAVESYLRAILVQANFAQEAH